MTLTEREAATLRAALHCWRNELSYFTTEELQGYYPDLRGIEPLGIDEVQGLLRRADEALYRAKSLGRNCVCSASELSQS